MEYGNYLHGRSQRGYEFAKDKLQIPMMMLAAILAVLLMIPMATSVSASTEHRLDVAGWVIWGVFVVEYLGLLWLAPKRRQMVMEHPVELLLIVIPIFRPLRLLRLLRVFVGAGAAYKTLSQLVNRKGLQWFCAIASIVLGIGAFLIWVVERTDANSQITDLGDALWWATVTATTVGYGDVTPVTPAGRVIAVVLMMLGISIVSVITANIAAVLVDAEAESEMERLEAKIDELIAVLAVSSGELEISLPDRPAGNRAAAGEVDGASERAQALKVDWSGHSLESSREAADER